MPTAKQRRGTKKKPRSVVINIRLKKEQRDLIDRQAENEGKNRSEFMIEASTRAAQESHLDTIHFKATQAQWNAMMKALDEPARAIPALKKLLASKSPWEK